MFARTVRRVRLQAMLAIASIRRTRRANRHQIIISNRAKIGGLNRDQCLSPTGGRHELNPERMRAIDLHDRAQIASSQPVGWNVTGQNGDIKEVERSLGASRISQ
jgi:hypothetical protein